nr:G-type lectin S-receptor-like serine/threonine-protein kinase At1g67520 [Tanacetum cinerariifolium]
MYPVFGGYGVTEDEMVTMMVTRKVAHRWAVTDGYNDSEKQSFILLSMEFKFESSPCEKNGGLFGVGNDIVSLRSMEITSEVVGLSVAWTGCTFNESGHGSCVTGDCGGEMECNGSNYTQPVTVAKISLSTDDEFYNVSIINGFNIPMTVEPSRGGSCEIAGCVNNLNERCPSELKYEAGGGCMNCEGSCDQFNYWWLFKWACPKAIYGSDFNTYSCRHADYTVRFCPPSNTFSTIKLGRQYTGDVIFSNNGIFKLFNVGVSGSDIVSFAVVSMSNDARIWSANWKVSSSPDGGTLSIDPNTGNMIVTEGRKIVLQITNVQAGPNPNVTATLEDNGNFRLINESNKRVLWESFDYPRNVLLPGMKLGYDLKSGKNWTLTSHLSEDVYTPGAFSLSWEPAEERLVIRRRNQPYWTSGQMKDQTFPYLRDQPNKSKSGCMKDSTNLRKCKKGNYTISHDYCWNECNCVGFNSSNSNRTGCTMFSGSNSLSHSVESSYQAYVISSNNPSPHKNGMHLIWILIGTSVAIVLLCLGLLWCHNKRKHRHE